MGLSVTDGRSPYGSANRGAGAWSSRLPHHGRMPFPHDQVSYFGRTTARAKLKLFGIRQADRFSHMYVIGKTGSARRPY